MRRVIRQLPLPLRALLLSAVVALAAPAIASAAQKLAITSPTGFPAGGHPSYTTAITLDTSAGAPGKLSLMLAPGALASVSANPACVKGAPQHTSVCQIGSGTATAMGLFPISLKAYLVPPPNGDLAGIDLVPAVGPVTHAGAALVQTSTGQVATALKLDLASLGAIRGLITQMTLTVNGTLNGKPFNRMPTNCSPGASTLTITYASKTEKTTASPDIKPTGCAALPFHPTITGSAVKDAHDSGAAVTTTVTQGADEAASSSTTLLLPWPTLAPNFSSLSVQNTPTPVGTATTTSPLLPTPLRGHAFLTGSPTAPTMTLRFPPPATLTLTGAINLAQHSVDFAGIPDVPVTKLTVTLFGGPNALLGAGCAHPTGVLGGSFTGQNGKSGTASQTLTVANCPGTKPAGPKLSAVSLVPGRFKAKTGSKLKLTLSAPATVTVAVKRTVHGHSLHHKCSVHIKHGKRCTVRINRSVSFHAKAGANSFAFHMAKLPAGKYTARVSAVAGGLHSNKVRVRFTIT